MQSLDQATPLAPFVPAKIDIAIDAGNANTKVRATHEQAITFRSVLAPLSTANQMGTWPTADVIFINGVWWVAGEAAYTYASDAVQENTTVTRYTSAWYRTLFAFALHKVLYTSAGQDILSPRIISSIPAEIYKDRSQANEIKGRLTGRYDIRTVTGKLLQVEVEDRKLTILPEGIGTYFERVYDQPNGVHYRHSNVAIFDLGYLTLDMVVMQNNQYAPTLSRSDEHTGMALVATSIRDYIFQQRRVRLSRSEIDAVLQQDEIKVNGSLMNIAEIRAKALTELGNRLVLLVSQWTAGLNLDMLILTGGGAKHIFPYLQLSSAFPPVLLAGPRSNVDGAYRYMTQGNTTEQRS